MELTPLFRHNAAALMRWSPNGQHFATVVAGRVIVRSLPECKVIKNWAPTETPQYLEWDGDGHSLLCANYAKASVQAWSLLHSEWQCNITEGVYGLSAVHWSPDGAYILTFSEMQIRATIWSLQSKEIRYIPFPKYCDKGYAFSRSGLYFAMAFRKERKDYILVFSTQDWKIVSQFMSETLDLEDLFWSSKDEFICIRDTILEYKLCLYSIDGSCYLKYSAYDKALGIKSAAPSPTLRFVALGSFDQKVRLLNLLTGEIVMEGEHTNVIAQAGVSIFREESIALEASVVTDQTLSKTKFVSAAPPVVITTTKWDPKLPDQKVGVSVAQWSVDSRLLMTRNDNMPSSLWIWDVATLRLHAVLLFKKAIRAASWSQIDHRIAICTATDQIFMWQPGSCSIIPVPAGFVESLELSSIRFLLFRF
eukprot:TRINITY_DN10836_c0_g1_i1.p1 TRINITY_DN10836_c0_g1~~TRINITY_DN10836_c0_g1_i1.p1  ORF type:complete len:421 (+),score=57.27 TRINITY_DN10836_c0_g1_i1:52-1314(+)